MIECKTLLNNPIVNEYYELQTRSQSLIVESFLLYKSVFAISYYDIHGAFKIIKNSRKIEQELNQLKQTLKATNIANFILKESLRKARKTKYIESEEINIVTNEITKNMELVDKSLISISSGLFQKNILGLMTNTVQMMKLFVVDTSTCIIESMGFLSSATLKDYY